MIPKEVSERWAPMWPAGRLADRPWWNFPNGVRRCDGTIPAREESDPGYWDGKETLAAYVERIDREHPLPVPPPMPGQVWAREGDEVWMPSLVPSQKSPWTVTWPLVVQGVEVDPAKGWILVYGPTPWGPNMPWMDTRA